MYVASDQDKQHVREMNIPAYAVIDIRDTLLKVLKRDYFQDRPMVQLLPKYSLLDLIKKLSNAGDPMYSNFSYVYYTEGDQILHMRRWKALQRAIDSRAGKDLIIPHRLEVYIYR